MKIRLPLKTKGRKGIQVKILLELSDKTSVRIQSEIKTTKYYYIRISLINILKKHMGILKLYNYTFKRIQIKIQFRMGNREQNEQKMHYFRDGNYSKIENQEPTNGLACLGLPYHVPFENSG